MDLYEFEANLVYKVSYWAAGATQRNLSQKRKERKKSLSLVFIVAAGAIQAAVGRKDISDFIQCWTLPTTILMYQARCAHWCNRIISVIRQLTGF